MKTSLFRAAAGAAVVCLSIAAQAAPAMKVADAIWANGRLYDTVLTPTSFRAPPAHTLDRLYNFAMSGLSGQRSVSESAPGDPTYNGGRWWVQMVVFTAQGIAALDADGDGAIDAELTDASDVLAQAAAGNLEIFATETFFVCPLNRGGR